MKLSTLSINPNNPRHIKDSRFAQLVTSIKNFPDMMAARPLVVNEAGVILGGNMRFRALKELKYSEVPAEWVRTVKGWTPEQEAEFLIKDNANFGEWDYDALANEWDNGTLSEWGVPVWTQPEEADYSILDDDESGLDVTVADMAGGVKKAIQIEFNPEHYDEAYKVVQYFRDQDANVGKMILDFLNAEKVKA